MTRLCVSCDITIAHTTHTILVQSIYVQYNSAVDKIGYKIKFLYLVLLTKNTTVGYLCRIKIEQSFHYVKEKVVTSCIMMLMLMFVCVSSLIKEDKFIFSRVPVIVC